MFKLFSFRRERLKETSKLRSDLEIFQSDYLVFKRLPLLSPLAWGKRADSFFCMLQPSQSAHPNSGIVYLQVSLRLLQQLDTNLAKKVAFPVCDFHEYTPIHVEI